QRDLSNSHDRIGDVRKGQGDLAGALVAYEAALAIRERLSALDPNHTEWQRDLAISHERIGDVRKEQGDLVGARESFEKELTIALPLFAKTGAAEVPRFLGTVYRRLVVVCAAQGDWQAALEYGRERVAQSRRAADPADLACALGTQSYCLLLDRQFQAAITAAEEALTLNPGLLWVVTNQAHGYLLTEQFDRAQAIYQNHATEMVREGQTFAQVVLDDFDALREQGIDHPMMEDIADLFRQSVPLDAEAK
ncbi:hypothetical protein ThidrDRAFT_4029, partial [Thiorhodococcus drewsii AZ1]